MYHAFCSHTDPKADLICHCFSSHVTDMSTKVILRVHQFSDECGGACLHSQECYTLSLKQLKMKERKRKEKERKDFTNPMLKHVIFKTRKNSLHFNTVCLLIILAFQKNILSLLSAFYSLGILPSF